MLVTLKYLASRVRQQTVTVTPSDGQQKAAVGSRERAASARAGENRPPSTRAVLLGPAELSPTAHHDGAGAE
jgi:hypothetical protein